MSSYVGLNVGGKIYKTSRTTLNSVPDSFFPLLLSDHIPSEKDDQGNYLIDRDGKLFRYVLNFLRCGKLALPEDFTDIGQLESEADFYQLEALKTQIKEQFSIGFVVNGSVYHISKAEALIEPDSFFADVFNRPREVRTPRDANGNYRISRNERNFIMIHNYLKENYRSPKGILGINEKKPELIHDDVRTLLAEAEHFRLTILLESLRSVQPLRQYISLLHLYCYDNEAYVIYTNTHSFIESLTFLSLAGTPCRISRNAFSVYFQLPRNNDGEEEMQDESITVYSTTTSSGGDAGGGVPRNQQELIEYISRRTNRRKVKTIRINERCTKVEFVT